MRHRHNQYRGAIGPNQAHEVDAKERIDLKEEKLFKTRKL